MAAAVVGLVGPLTPAATDIASAAASTQPRASNTGVPSGVSLRIHNGDLTITKPGTVIDRMDIRGYVIVKADNVTIKRSIVRGGKSTQARALIMNWWGARNLVVVDSTLRATREHTLLDGLSGSNFLAERLEIARVVDPVKIIGGNVTVRRSWLHDSTHSKRDPNSRDGKTHDDNIQITGGSNIRLTYNTLEGANNAAIMVSSARYRTRDIHILGNWISGGACQINVTTSDQGPIRDMHIRMNKFGTGQYGSTCPMRLPKSSSIAYSENRMMSNGAQPRPVRF